MASGIVQYVLVRGDLLTKLQWPVGAVIAQACHACTAVTHLFHDDEHTQKYLMDLDHMHKVVLEVRGNVRANCFNECGVLFYNELLSQVPDEQSLVSLAEKLKENQIDHKMWTEQPENIPTCLVVKPYPKNDVQKYFKKFKLFKGV